MTSGLKFMLALYVAFCIALALLIISIVGCSSARPATWADRPDAQPRENSGAKLWQRAHPDLAGVKCSIALEDGSKIDFYSEDVCEDLPAISRKRGRK